MEAIMTRSILIAAAAMAMGSFCIMAPANAAQPIYIQGGPSQHDGMCQVSADGFGSYGYVTACPRPAMTIKHGKKVKS
jgi:hypothetical protein